MTPKPMHGRPRLQKLKYISSYRDRHGKVRWRFRKKGCQDLHLKGDYGSEEFMIGYAEALKSKIEVGSSRVSARSMDALIIRYLNSSDFERLAKSTQTVYRRILDNFRIQYGSLSVRGLQRRHIKQIIDKMPNSPTSANRLLSLLSILLDIRLDLEWVQINHARTIKKVKIKVKGFVAWTDEEIQKYLDMYPSGSRERLAFYLYLYTGQRGCDVVRMSRADIKDNTISVVQQKTGVKLRIPLHQELKSELALHEDKMMFLLTEYGKPFSVKGFQQWFAKSARRAGLANCTGHGMRKVTGKKLADVGCTPHQIQAITGHKTLSEIARYTKSADQVKLASSAIEKMK